MKIRLWVPVISLALFLCVAFYFSVGKEIIFQHNHHWACETHVVKQIGGCDKHGICGVELDDKTSAAASLPVIGYPSKVRCHWEPNS